MRFLGLGLEDKVPDAKTVWHYREQLAQAGVIETLFEDFDGYLEKQGYLAMGGQIIDASIVPVPKQRNSRDENARIKDGETPEGWDLFRAQLPGTALDGLIADLRSITQGVGRYEAEFSHYHEVYGKDAEQMIELRAEMLADA